MMLKLISKLSGTGNGMIKSLLDLVGEPCAPANAILAAIRGLISDIDIESEKYRWMGSARIEFYLDKYLFFTHLYRKAIVVVTLECGVAKYLRGVLRLQSAGHAMKCNVSKVSKKFNLKEKDTLIDITSFEIVRDSKNKALCYGTVVFPTAAIHI
ncbi:hypothetical protein Tco_1530530 [Tanacetum coccineum]